MTSAALQDKLPSATETRQALRQVVSSRDFLASPRLKALLSFIVEKTLEGDEDCLNQRGLATAVFGRGEDFDPEVDAIVRVEMSKLRRALDNYYSESREPHILRISIPRGRYVPLLETPRRSALQQLYNRHHNGDIKQKTLAIRPFTVFGSAIADPAFAESLRDELEVVLARLPGLHVLAPTHETGVGESPRYELLGTIKHDSHRLRVNLRLVTEENGEMLWSERFEHELGHASSLDVIDGITAAVMARVADEYGGTINRTLIADLDIDKEHSFNSSEALLCFYRYLSRHSDESYALARRAVEDAWPRDPENATLTAVLADMRRAGYALGYTDEAEPLSECEALARRAVALAPDSTAARLSLGFALLALGQQQQVMALANDLLDDPVLSPGYRGEAAMLLSFSGDWERGCAVIKDVCQVLTAAPHSFGYPLVLRAFHEADYEAALLLAQQLQPSQLFWHPMLLAAANGHTGRKEAASGHLSRLLRARPAFPMHGRRWIHCFLPEQALVDKLLDGLRLASLSSD